MSFDLIYPFFVADGDQSAYPTLMKHIEKLEPGGTFDNIELIEGWLVKEDKQSKGSKKTFTWQKRTSTDIKTERQR